MNIKKIMISVITPYHNKEDKRFVVKFKDECKGRPIAKFVSLQPKIYSVIVLNDRKIVMAKGVQNALVKKDFLHEMSKQSLDERKEFRHKQVAVSSYGHQRGVYKQDKITLNPLDTKKWIADDGITKKGIISWNMKSGVLYITSSKSFL